MLRRMSQHFEFLHHSFQNDAVIKIHTSAALWIFTSPAWAAMGFGIPCHLFSAESADCFVPYGDDLAWAWSVGILFSPPQANSEKFLICHQSGIAVHPEIPLVLQNPLDHMFVPLGSMLMIAHTLPGHLVSDLTVGAAQQVVGEDRPYKLCFLRLAVDPAVLNLIAERYFSLPSHLSHHPLYVF